NGREIGQGRWFVLGGSGVRKEVAGRILHGRMAHGCGYSVVGFPRHLHTSGDLAVLHRRDLPKSSVGIPFGTSSKPRSVSRGLAASRLLQLLRSSLGDPGFPRPT